MRTYTQTNSRIQRSKINMLFTLHTRTSIYIFIRSHMKLMCVKYANIYFVMGEFNHVNRQPRLIIFGMKL